MPLYIAKPHAHKLPKDSKSRLINAKTKVAALAFAVRDFYLVEPAEYSEVHELAKEGVEIETAVEG